MILDSCKISDRKKKTFFKDFSMETSEEKFAGKNNKIRPEWLIWKLQQRTTPSPKTALLSDWMQQIYKIIYVRAGVLHEAGWWLVMSGSLIALW